MKWFVDVQYDGEPRLVVLGPYDEFEDASATKQLVETDHPTATVSDPAERDDDYLSTLPQVTSIYTVGGVNYQAWSDGTVEVVS